jgi:ribonuclease Z
MTRLVQTRLVNDPFGDPGVFVDFRFGRRALLFDAGDLTLLAAREMLRVSHVFISHRHMDHFAGFDRLLRLALYRPGALRVIGPPGMADAIAAKLQAYTWNLLDEGAVDFSILAAEFDADELGPWTAFRARNRFNPEPAEENRSPLGTVLDEYDFRIDCTTLDHGIPCLAFALQERLRVNVWKEGLDAMDLEVGAWLNTAKSAVRGGAPDHTPIEVGPGRMVELGQLRKHALQVTAGQRIAYVTDAAFHPTNAERIIAIGRNADHLYIEAAFLDEDAGTAADRRHLTARQAGELAREAGAKRMTLFHHSQRYLERLERLRLEADRAFRE